MTLNIKTENAAFCDADTGEASEAAVAAECGRILRGIAAKLDKGQIYGQCHDVNGNHVGEWCTMEQKQAQHTPGPWRTFRCEVGKTRRHLLFTAYAQSGNSVAMGTEVTKANVRLAAASPALLAALVDLLPYAEMQIHALENGNKGIARLAAAHAAIAAATGKGSV